MASAERIYRKVNKQNGVQTPARLAKGLLVQDWMWTEVHREGQILLFSIVGPFNSILNPNSSSGVSQGPQPHYGCEQAF